MTALLWTLAVAMIAVGVAGCVWPALPGLFFILGGIVLAGYAEGFAHIGPWTLGVATALTLLGVAIEYVTGILTAKRAGASKWGLAGAALGGIAGIFMGVVGVFVLPLVGAVIGELIAHGDALRAGHVGVATGIGMVIGTVAKLAIAFTLLGVLTIALLV
jgi:uncharacterized protein YqgC (DUF456 family)